ncbi:hypothetical protein ABLE92_07580 [Gordonia sp. VNQ95]|uniref:variant leucine-rich repeat-containing protein n=1 Tax=Gordonia TaxID=2053 RepID=UPI0032B5537C
MIEHIHLAGPAAVDVLARRRGGGISISGSIGYIVAIIVLIVAIAAGKWLWQNREMVARQLRALQGPGNQNSMPPNGLPPNGMSPNGMPPNGMSPNGMPPNAMPPGSMQPGMMPPVSPYGQMPPAPAPSAGPPIGAAPPPPPPPPPASSGAPGPAPAPVPHATPAPSAPAALPGDVRMARDPQTPRHVLVHMANNAPQLHPHLLENPALEPGLRQWLSTR